MSVEVKKLPHAIYFPNLAYLDSQQTIYCLGSYCNPQCFKYSLIDGSYSTFGESPKIRVSAFVGAI